jgi:TPR repeat protein
MANYMEEEWDADPLGHDLWYACETLKINSVAGLEEISALAERGSPLAMAILGDAHLYGRHGLPVTKNLGEKYLEEAGRHGSRDARYRLAKHYLNQSDFERAERELSALVDTGYVPALHALAAALYRGDWQPKDPERALRLWRLAERQGHLPSKRWIAYVYRKGEMGLWMHALGLVKTAQLLVLYPFYLLRRPRSARLVDW